jgi:hypothetical protein
MLPLHPNVKNLLMIIPVSPCSLQPLHLIIIQPPSYYLFELLLTDLLPCLRFFGGLQSGLETCLHAYAEGGIEGYGLGVSSDLDGLVGGCAFLDSQESVAHGLKGECAGYIGGTDA